MSAIVYSWDPSTGAYVGTTNADEDQMAPGELLMPAFTTREEPPTPPDGHGAFWRGNIDGTALAEKTWEVLRVDAPVPSPSQAESDTSKFMRAQALAQAVLDTAARQLGYDNILTGVTYAEEPAVQKFQTEGKRLRRLRSLVWAECYSMLDEIQAGAPWPDEASFLARLPTYDEVVIMEESGGS
jgi:hypothetical protein